MISDDELVKLYDITFESEADRRSFMTGNAHLAALRAVYQKGVDDGHITKGGKK